MKITMKTAVTLKLRKQSGWTITRNALRRFLEIPPEVLGKAVAFFRSVDAEWPKEHLRAMFEQYGPHEWFMHIYDKEIADSIAKYGRFGAIGMHPHMSWGMALRNGLRSTAGLPDNLLPMGNWDDYYVSVLEVALGFRSLSSLPDSE